VSFEDRQRRKEKRERLKKTRVIAITAVILVCLTGWLFTDSQFVKGLIYSHSTYERNVILEVDQSLPGEYSVFKNDILFTTKNGICLYSMDGNLIHTANYDEVSAIIATYQEPAVRVFDNCLIAFDKSGREFVIFNNKRVIHEGETEYTIQTARVFKNGCFSLITGDAGAKNQMIFYGEKGKKEFVWHSGVDNIVDVAISDNGKKIAIATAELNAGSLNTKVLMFNRGETKAYAERKYDNILISNINFIKNSELMCVGDSGLFYLDLSCNEKKIYSFGERFLSFFKITDNGTAVLNFSSISDSRNITEIIKNGNLKGSYTSSDAVKSIDVKNGNILLNHEKTADIISMRGNKLRTVNCGRELENAYFIGRNKILLVGKTDVKIIR